MLKISLDIIEIILKDYGVFSKPVSFIELQRYNYDKNNLTSKQVRLIIKVKLNNGSFLVVRFKNEHDVSLDLIEKQSQFAALLKENGINTPVLYKSAHGFAKWYSINEYHAIVTVEEFVNGELRYVDTDIAKKTGMLLAEMHNISEASDFHVKNNVLFDPFTDNDLFAYTDFISHVNELSVIDSCLCQNIIQKYNEYIKILSSVQKEPRYAVQGDISDCNLYETDKDCIGIFDFNRCGDNNLYCDVIMQAVFEARLMDYPESYNGKNEVLILPAFLKGYEIKRPFSDLHKQVYPYLYAIINAFWSGDIKWNENGLIKQLEKGNSKAVHKWLKEIYRKLLVLEPIPL